MNAQDKYRDFCKKNKLLPIYAYDWWLDVVCGGEQNWDSVILEKGNNLQACLPYFVQHKMGMHFLVMPPLTQTLGPWFAPTEGTLQRQLQRQKELTYQLIEALPPHHQFRQHFHRSVEYWLPWYWKGYEQTTRYSYVLQDTSDSDALWKGLGSSVRKEIRKAEKRFSLRVKEMSGLESVHTFLELNKKTFARKNQPLPYPEDLVHKLHAAASKHDCCQILIATDEENMPFAGAFLVWDHQSLYYLMGGIDSERKTSGAMSLVMWHGIQLAHRLGKQFDFEGSMNEDIEKFFRNFGGTPLPYFRISKTNSRLLASSMKGKEALKHLIRKTQ